VNHHDALREIAQNAREVAELIHKPGHRDAGQFQTEVREMQSHGPDVELRNIQGQLGAVAVSIEAYLGA
jgi:hypothetical protein